MQCYATFKASADAGCTDNHIAPYSFRIRKPNGAKGGRHARMWNSLKASSLSTVKRQLFRQPLSENLLVLFELKYDFAGILVVDQAITPTGRTTLETITLWSRRFHVYRKPGIMSTVSTRLNSCFPYISWYACLIDTSIGHVRLSACLRLSVCLSLWYTSTTAKTKIIWLQ